jgi:hypothetical protein
MMNHGIHVKTRSSSITMMMSRMSAQIVMIGIDSEQIMPNAGGPHGPIFPTIEILVERPRQHRQHEIDEPKTFRALDLIRRTSDRMNAVFLLNLRMPGRRRVEGKRDPDRTRGRVWIEKRRELKSLAGHAQHSRMERSAVGFECTHRRANQPGRPPWP